MRPQWGGRVHFNGECEKCGKQWSTRNIMGLAAQHAERCSGRIRVEIGYVYYWNDPDHDRRVAELKAEVKT